MRPLLVLLAGGVMIAGCVPMPQVVSVPAPAGETIVMPPVGVTIVDVDDDRVLVSTNQPAHVAVFELVPNRGVRLVYPVSPKQRRVAQSGSTWLALAGGSTRDDRMARGDRYDRVLNRAPVRYLYALASERPLWLTDASFDDEWLPTMLGGRAGRVADPYETMEAIARRFLPPVPDDREWGEDLYRLESARRAPPVRIAKVYCPDGSVVYVRDDEADRGACPWGGRDRGRGAGAPRPDSVVNATGRRVAHRPEARAPRPSAVYRVPRPVNRDSALVQQAGSAPAGPARGDSASERGRGRDREKEKGQDKDKEKEKEKEKDKEQGDNGRHLGWGKSMKGAPMPVKSEPTMEAKVPVVRDTQPAARPANGLMGRLRPVAPAPVQPSRTDSLPAAPAPSTQPSSPKADSAAAEPRRPRPSPVPTRAR